VVIVDEVLAVGDAEFRRRCLNRMSEFGSEGRTVLFVSHDPGLVGQLCRRALWLEEGRLRQDGRAHDVLAAYLASTLSPSERSFASLRPGGPLGEVSLALVDDSGEPRHAVRRDETLRLNLRLSTTRRTMGLDAALFVLDQRGARVFMENASEAGLRFSSAPTDYDITVSVPPLLAEGEYRAGLWIGTEYETFLNADFLSLSLLPLPIDRQASARGVVRPSIEWDVNGQASHLQAP
jgi:hypothetical protein